MSEPYTAMFINPEYVTDPPEIAEKIHPEDLVVLHLAKVRAWQVQLESELEVVRHRVKMLEGIG
jgi:hypothetical protein